jgi:hypothetical protein
MGALTASSALHTMRPVAMSQATRFRLAALGQVEVSLVLALLVLLPLIRIGGSVI